MNVEELRAGLEGLAGPAIDAPAEGLERVHRADRRQRRLRVGAVLSALGVVLAVTVTVVLARDTTKAPHVVSPAETTATTVTTVTTVTTTPPQFESEVGPPKVSVFPGLPALDASALTAPLVSVTPVDIPGGRSVGGFAGYDDHGVWFSTSVITGQTLNADVMPLDGSLAPLRVPGDLYDFAEQRGVHWLLVREYQAPSDQQYHLLRFPEGASRADYDVAIPLDDQLAGKIVVTDDGVWIPTRTSILRLDPGTGSLAASISLPYELGHYIAPFGSQILVAEGNRMLSIDPTTNAVAATTDLVPAGAGEVEQLVAVDGTIWATVHEGDTNTKLIRLDSDLQPGAEMDLPAYFAMGTDGTRLWLNAPLQIGVPKNYAANAQAIVLIDQASATVSRTIVLRGLASEFAWIAPDELLIGGQLENGGSGGVDTTLYRVPLG